MGERGAGRRVRVSGRQRATFLAGIAGALLLQSCATITVDRRLPSPAEDPGRWILVWSDEFEGEDLDLGKWSHRAPGPRREAVNSPAMAALDGKGRLVLSTRLREGRIETAMIGTADKFSRAGGYFEISARVPRTRGHWAAFWLQSPAFGRYPGDTLRSGAEIDIMESFRPDLELVTHNLHWDGYGPGRGWAGLGLPGRVRVPGLAEGFHRFGLEWGPGGYAFNVDGVVTWRTDKAPSAAPQYIILSLEVGPSQARVVRSTPDFADDFVVDYVRVYAPAGEAAPPPP